MRPRGALRAACLAAAAAAGMAASGAGAQSTQNRSMIVEDRNGTRADCSLRVGDFGIFNGVRRERSLLSRPRRQLFSVTVLNGLSDTAASIDATFNAASTLMQQDSGSSDSNCCVAILRTGAVSFVNTPAAVPGGAIVNQGDVNAIVALPGDIKVVASIGFCGQAGSYVGCRTGGTIILVTGFPSSTVAHEIDRSEGLCHVASNCNPTCGQAGTCSGCGDPSANNIMYYRVCSSPVQDRFTSAQCTSFRSGASR